MRLLDLTHFPQIKFYEVADPRSVSYVILSHVWGKADDVEGREPTFQELSSIISATIPELPEDPRYKKLKGFCEVVHEQGYTLAWADMCCIDKTSSAELSEAIASMFYWYRCAEVCYAYLRDVPSPSPQQDEPSTSVPSSSRQPHEPTPAQLDTDFLQTFRQSSWFTRGWTLQELIAPRSVVFFSNDWFILGSKCGELASTICAITRVDKNVLTHQKPLESVSVAHRMSWAANRSTTRLEDRAYSLMGLFGVAIPILYGEQGYAFIRLQEEILRRIADPTLLAWGPPVARWPTGLGLQIVKEGRYSSRVLRQGRELHVRARDLSSSSANYYAGYLFAPSPEAFQEAIHPTGSRYIGAPSLSRTRTDRRSDGPRKMHIIPPNVLEMEATLIPAIIPLSNDGASASARASRTFYLLPLNCETTQSEPIALLLCPSTMTSTDAPATNDPYWVIGTCIKEPEGPTTYRRIVTLPPSCHSDGSLPEPQPAPLNTLTGSVHLPLSAPTTTWTTNDDAENAFRAKCGFFNIRLGGWCEAALNAARFEVRKGEPTETDMVYLFVLLPPKRCAIFTGGRDSGPALDSIEITFGTCPGLGSSPSDPNHSEDCQCIFTGSIKTIPGNSKYSGTPSSLCSSCDSEVGDHIVFDADRNSGSGMWSSHGGIAVRSTSFLVRVADDIDKTPTSFKLTVSLRRAPSSTRPPSLSNATQGYLLEIEFHPDPQAVDRSSPDGTSATPQDGFHPDPQAVDGSSPDGTSATPQDGAQDESINIWRNLLRWLQASVICPVREVLARVLPFLIVT